MLSTEKGTNFWNKIGKFSICSGNDLFLFSFLLFNELLNIENMLENTANGEENGITAKRRKLLKQSDNNRR